MYDQATRERAVALHRSGLTFSEISRSTGISRFAIREWTVRITPSPGMSAECPLGDDGTGSAVPQADYAYLLGLYLGDGCISAGRRGVHALRIACGDAWPGLIDECARAMAAVMPHNSVNRVRSPGCTSVVSTSKHWPCLFPQHGAGPKHLRRIALAPWQQRTVDTHPWELLRGLVHSDGCRITNWTTRVVGDGTRRYEYPRYFFTNTSSDIVRIFTDTLDAVDVRWKAVRRPSGAVDVSVARRACVALMDAHIGAKY
ncbi:transcriptional regulator [Kitasatospora sp. NPDC056138]|uniref:transcriptional regulator n=1 Tax=Kitasatospora sp. NPDC056138 TaxID=3345724 RepID=UPI0035DCB796